jgi:hypothetical protein
MLSVQLPSGNHVIINIASGMEFRKRLFTSGSIDPRFIPSDFDCGYFKHDQTTQRHARED